MNQIRSRGHRLLPALAIFFIFLLSVSGVSVWLARASEDLVKAPAIYWTDASDIIHRANLDGSQVEVALYVSGSASAIIVDQEAEEMIFWAPAISEGIMLWRAGLDGSNLRKVFSNLHDYLIYYWDEPIAMDLDVENRDLYWPSDQPYYPYEVGSIVRGNIDDGDIGIRFMPGPVDPGGFAEVQPDLEIDETAGMFYWTSSDAIRRATMDGVDAEVMQFTLWEESSPLEYAPFAVDSEAGKIYYVGEVWSDFDSEIVLVRADLAVPQNREVLVTLFGYGEGQIMDVAVDTVHDKVYWSQRGRETAIKRANLDGADVETIADQVNGPQGLALDPVAGKIYWTDWLSQKIQRANLDGSAVEDLVNTAPMRPGFLTLNTTDEEIYWTGQGNGRVWRAALEGGASSLLVPGDSTRTGGIAYNSVTDTLYWTDTAGQFVTRARSDGTEITNVLYPRVGAARGLFVEEETGKIVWYDRETQSIKRANLNGSATETVLSGEFGEVTSMAWDPLRRTMCWADPLMRSIECAGWNGEGRRIILSEENGLLRPNVLAVDPRGGHVYWTDWGTMSLHRVNLDGSEMVDIVRGTLIEPSGLALYLEPLEIQRTYLPLVNGPAGG